MLLIKLWRYSVYSCLGFIALFLLLVIIFAGLKDVSNGTNIPVFIFVVVIELAVITILVYFYRKNRAADAAVFVDVRQGKAVDNCGKDDGGGTGPLMYIRFPKTLQRSVVIGFILFSTCSILLWLLVDNPVPWIIAVFFMLIFARVVMSWDEATFGDSSHIPKARRDEAAVNDVGQDSAKNDVSVNDEHGNEELVSGAQSNGDSNSCAAMREGVACEAVPLPDEFSAKPDHREDVASKSDGVAVREVAGSARESDSDINVVPKSSWLERIGRFFVGEINAQDAERQRLLKLANMTAKELGEEGEGIVKEVLHQLDGRKYNVLNDLNLCWKEDGKMRTAQVDHVIISRNGIFVIETKNMKGWVSGKSENKWWHQNTGRNKNTNGKAFRTPFLNPVQQNQGHVDALRTITRLPVEVFHNIVVFAGRAKFDGRLPSMVIMNPDDLLRVIQGYRKNLLSDSNVIVLEWKIKRHNDPASKRRHVSNIKISRYLHWKNKHKK